MIRVTPLQFKDSFLKVVSTKPMDSQLVALWSLETPYTKLILEEVLPNIATELGISTWDSDYYFLDSIFYAELDEHHFGPDANYAKCVNIAMEHEHIIDGTEVEMNKLQLFNTPLKVLITYAADETQRVHYLNRYAKILQGADIFGDFATLRRQLVVFGSRSGQVVTWHFYAYEPTGFKAI